MPVHSVNLRTEKFCHSVVTKLEHFLRVVSTVEFRRGYIQKRQIGTANAMGSSTWAALPSRL